MVRMVPHTLVGFPHPVYLPDDIRVRINIVPDRFIGWVRSGTPNAVDYSTWHDTGDPGSRARDQEAYLHGGPKGPNGAIRQVGYTGAVDDIEFVQLTPGNEDTWAAGTPDGNHLSHHIEQCFGPGIDFEKSFRNAAAVHGGIIASYPGWQLVPSLRKHRDWSGKWCPAQVLNAGRWPEAVALAQTFFLLARAAAAGQDPATPPQAVELPWPTETAVNDYIHAVSLRNAVASPLGGLGRVFLEDGARYGINPAVAVAFMMRETQLGTDSTYRRYASNNFGWHKAGPGRAQGTATPATFTHNGSEYARFATPEDGIRAWFFTINRDVYRATGGRLTDIMQVYAPASDGNSHADGLRIFATVGDALGVPITGDAQVYGDPPAPAPVPVPPDDPLPRAFGGVDYEGRRYAFDPNGPVSRAWLARAEDTGRYPRLIDVWADSAGRRFLFSDGVLFTANGATVTASDANRPAQ